MECRRRVLGWLYLLTLLPVLFLLLLLLLILLPLFLYLFLYVIFHLLPYFLLYPLFYLPLLLRPPFPLSLFFHPKGNFLPSAFDHLVIVAMRMVTEQAG